MRQAAVAPRAGALWVAALLLCSLLVACGDRPQPGAPDSGLSPGDLCASTTPRGLDEVYASHFASSAPTGCISGCHELGAGGLTFRSASELWQATVERPSTSDPAYKLVEPGAPERSQLYLKLTPQAASRMPVGGPFLEEAALREVAGWICAGALPPSGDGGTPLPDGGTAHNPTPRLDSITPPSVLAGSGEVTLTLAGSGFLSSSTVTFDGATMAYLLVDSGRLTVHLPASLTAEPGTHLLQVLNPAPGGGKSNTLSFQAVASANAPVVTALSPCGTVAGTGAFTLTLQGSGFAPGATVTFNSTPVQVSSHSATQLQALVPAELVALAPAEAAVTVTVTNPERGGGTSSPVYFGLASQVRSLTADIQPLFSASCAGSGCHGSPATPVNLTTAERSYAELVGQPSSGCSGRALVLACGPLRSQSVLVDKILATNTSPACSGTPMPRGGSLTAAQKQAILDWVAQGAPR